MEQELMDVNGILLVSEGYLLLQIVMQPLIAFKKYATANLLAYVLK